VPPDTRLSRYVRYGSGADLTQLGNFDANFAGQNSARDALLRIVPSKAVSSYRPMR